MALTLAHATDSPAQAVTLFSLLQSGGFHPVIFNFHQGFMAIAYVNTMGGFRIMLPEDEIAAAKHFVHATKPLQDVDPIKPKLKRDIIYGSILSRNIFFGLYALPLKYLLSLTVFMWGTIFLAAVVWGDAFFYALELIMIAFTTVMQRVTSFDILIWAMTLMTIEYLYSALGTTIVTSLFISAVRLHAEYVALPKLRKSKETS